MHNLFYRWDWDEIRCDMLIIRVIMEPIATIALSATMPLAFIQFFSNYALVCFTGDRYCGINTPESQLENDRDVKLIVFLICILVLQIYERMVKTPQKAIDRLNPSMSLHTPHAPCTLYVCDRICEKGSYTRI